MCELFAVSAKKKIYLNDYLSELKAHSHFHPHGWGLAFFDGNSTLIEKEPTPAYESEHLSKLLETPIEESVFLAHIRLATVGNLIYENCHPFVGQDNSNRTWTMAHNGTIFKSELLEKYKNVELGTTDSEWIIFHIIESANELLANNIDMSNQKIRFEMMDKIILDIVYHNKLNLMVYDGELLYIHTNMANTLYYKNINSGIVFATAPLDNLEWTPLPMMQLFAYKEGNLVFSGTKHDYEYFLS